MSEQTVRQARATKTLAIRLEPELHARLSMLAKLAGMSVTELIRTAIENKLADLASDPQIVDRAEDLRAAIERNAAEQRDALSDLLAAGKPAAAPSKVTRTTK